MPQPRNQTAKCTRVKLRQSGVGRESDALIASYYEPPSTVSTRTPTSFPTRLTGKRHLLQGPSSPTRSDAEESRYGATYGHIADVCQQYSRGRSRAHNVSIAQRNRSSQQRKCRIDRELALTFLTEDRLLRYSHSRGLATHGSSTTDFNYGEHY